MISLFYDYHTKTKMKKETIKRALVSMMVGGMILANSAPMIKAAPTAIAGKVSYSKNAFEGCGGTWHALREKGNSTSVYRLAKETDENPQVKITGIWDLNGNDKTGAWNYFRMRSIVVNSTTTNVTMGGDYVVININSDQFQEVPTKKAYRKANSGYDLRIQAIGNSEKAGTVSGRIKVN